MTEEEKLLNTVAEFILADAERYRRLASGVTLPAMPECDGPWDDMVYTPEQLKAYAREAVLAERERLATSWESAHGFDKYAVAATIRKG